MNILILIILIIFPTLTHATSWKIDDLYTFTTSTNGSAGIVDADSVPTYRIYEDETGTAVLTGSMAKLDPRAAIACALVFIGTVTSIRLVLGKSLFIESKTASICV